VKLTTFNVTATREINC